MGNKKNIYGKVLKDLTGGLYTLYVKDGEVFVDDSTNDSEPIPGEGLVDGGRLQTHESGRNHPIATTSLPGLMSASDKTKLNGLTALGYTAENAANKGQANGYAGLDAGGKVPAAQLPSYVDDVLEFTNLAAFPATGENGKMYVALDANKVYRWSGSAYIEISSSPGTTDAVTEGSTNKYFTEARVRATVLTGLSIVTNMFIGASDTVLSALGKLQAQLKGINDNHIGGGGSEHAEVVAGGDAGFMTGSDKTKLDGIATGANKYVHPATAGNKHIPTGGAANQILKYSASGTAIWAAIDDALHGTRGGGTQHAAATQSTAGFMSAADKQKLDGLVAPSGTFFVVQASNPTVFPSGNVTFAGLSTLFSTGVYSIKFAVTSSTTDGLLELTPDAGLYVDWQTKGIGGIEYYVGEAQVFAVDKDGSGNLYLYHVGNGMTNY